MDDDHRPPAAADEGPALSRRGFAALSVAAGLTLSTTATAADSDVIETDVEVKTPDGTCDAALYHPKGKGIWPAVVVFPDALGAFAAAGLPATIEVYPGTPHGWCVKDSAIYNEVQAERAWSAMLTLYRSALV